jgi:hypothetical protein
MLVQSYFLLKGCKDEQDLPDLQAHPKRRPQEVLKPARGQIKFF